MLLLCQTYIIIITFFVFNKSVVEYSMLTAVFISLLI